MKYFKLFTCSLLFVSFCYGQNELRGKVVNHQNKPVAHAKIFLDSIDTNIETNRNGDYKVSFADNVAIINIYSHKYGLLSADYNNEDVMNFMFLESKNVHRGKFKKDDNIKIGYSEVESKYLVHNIQNVDSQKENDFSAYRNIYDIIRGRFPGVMVTKSNKIIIRGVNSVRNTSDPLFVVDGIIVSDIDYISTNNIKEITILKDAASSIYGSQASAGVIQITTKENK